MGSESEADKLAAPRLFGRKKQASTPEQPAAASAPVPAPAVEQPVAQTVEQHVEQTAVLPTPEPVRVAVPEATHPEATHPEATHPEPAHPEPAHAGEADAGEADAGEADAGEAPVRRRTLPDLSALPDVRVPGLSGQAAAAFTGLLVGAFLVFATYFALHGCSALRGTDTCGGKAGFPLLLAIGVVAVFGGGVLLRAFGATSPMGDSFLAVALVAVLSVLFLGEHYDAWWMILVIPVLTIGAFCLAHWVSVRYIDAEHD